MAYPKLVIDMKKIRHNTRMLVFMCKEKGIGIAAVTKVYCGRPEIARAVMEEGVTMLADSRIQNIRKLQELKIPKLLLRIPMLSEIEELIAYVDISLNSEIEVMEEISRVCIKHKKRHKIMLMIDLGDLREGIWEDELEETVEKIISLEGIELVGLGANFGCYGGVIPEGSTLEKLVAMARKIEDTFGICLEILSGGNSNSLRLVWENQMPKGINQLRLGQPIVLGKEDVYDRRIEGLYEDAFRLFAEVVEIKSKPSVPIGRRGMDAFGNIPVFEDRGVRKRAIIAMGRQDIMLEGITPVDEGTILLGASSDHLILDIQDGIRAFKIGDIVEFKMNYGALLAAMNSDYVVKEFVE